MLPDSLSCSALPSLVMDNDPFALPSSQNTALGLSSFSTLEPYSPPFNAARAFPPLATTSSQPHNTETTLLPPAVLNVSPFTTASEESLLRPLTNQSPSQPYDIETTLPPPAALNIFPFTITSQESLPRPLTYQSPMSATNATRRNPSHVPRPRNAFIIYRMLFNAFAQQDQKRNKDVTRGHPGENLRIRPINPRVISKQAAACWKTLSKAEKEVYEGLAKTEKELHMVKYPDYDYNYNAFNLGQKVMKGKTVRGGRASAHSTSDPLAGHLPLTQFNAPLNLDDCLPSIFDSPNLSDYPGELYPTRDGALPPLANDSQELDFDWNFP